MIERFDLPLPPYREGTYMADSLQAYTNTYKYSNYIAVVLG